MSHNKFAFHLNSHLVIYGSISLMNIVAKVINLVKEKSSVSPSPLLLPAHKELPAGKPLPPLLYLLLSSKKRRPNSPFRSLSSSGDSKSSLREPLHHRIGMCNRSFCQFMTHLKKDVKGGSMAFAVCSVLPP